MVALHATVTGVTRRLNGRSHLLALAAFMAIVAAHMAEHAVQAVQIYVLGWAVPESQGIAGLWWAWLVTSEWLHYVYAIVTLAGILVLLPGFTGRARLWWQIALVAQFWHHVEHVLLLGQRLTGHMLFGADVPTSLVQVVMPRVELHLFYNAVVFLPLVVALLLHCLPTASEPDPPCGCARWWRQRASTRAASPNQ